MSESIREIRSEIDEITGSSLNDNLTEHTWVSNDDLRTIAEWIAERQDEATSNDTLEESK